MSIEELVADSMVGLAFGGWAALRFSRCVGCEAPFSVMETLVRALTWSWECGRCPGHAEAPLEAEVVELLPANAELVRRHEEILAGWRTLAAG